MSLPDSNLDADLRAVGLPAGLLRRLRAIPLVDDEGLDAAINDVPTPRGLAAQLQGIPLADDAGLDEALREIQVPKQLTRTLKRPVRRISRTQRVGQWVMAASLAVGATAATVAIAVALHRHSETTSGPSIAATPIPSIGPTSGLEKSWASLETDNSDDHFKAKASAAGQNSAMAESTKPSHRLTSPMEVRLAQIEPPVQNATTTQNATTSQKSATGSTTNSLADAGSSGLLGMPRDVNPLLRPAENRGDGHALGMGSWDQLPELSIKSTQIAPRGIEWPLVPGAHREFLVMTGLHPFVMPSANARLATCQPPLVADASSYELAWRYLERNEMPPPERVHTEDFLAALPYDFPKPVGRNVGLTLFGGPSPITDGCMLLQVGIQARDIESNAHAPEHLIFLIDTSASMHWGSRIEIVRKALHSIGPWLGKDDRLSLVTFNQGAHVLVEDMLVKDVLVKDVQTHNMKIFLEAADSLSAEGSTDIASGLRVAYTLARQTTAADHPPAHVVLLTDGLLDLDPTAAQQIEHQVADAAARGVSLQAIDLGQQREGDPQLAALAKSGNGAVQRATHTEELQWALRDIVTGRNQVVARDARLQVAFNPKTVLEYRLLGHEATEWGGLLPAAVQSDLKAGQSATVVFEVRLAPGASLTTNKSNALASAELLWYEPKNDNERALERATATLHFNDLAATMSREAPALQQAAVIASTAEVLRHSPFIFRAQRIKISPALFHVWELACEVDSRLQQREDFSEFMSFISREMKAHATTLRAGQEK